MCLSIDLCVILNELGFVRKYNLQQVIQIFYGLIKGKEHVQNFNFLFKTDVII